MEQTDEPDIHTNPALILQQKIGPVFFCDQLWRLSINSPVFSEEYVTINMCSLVSANFIMVSFLAHKGG